MSKMVLAMRVSRYLPVSVIRSAAAIGSDIAWLKQGKAVLRLQDNLHRVTGKQGKELRKLSRQAMRSTARYYSEVLELPRMSGEVIDARVRMEHFEPVKKTMDKDGRIITAMAHAGNWDIVGAYACRNIAPVTSVAEVLKPREAFEAFVKLREDLGMTIFGLEGGGTFRQLMRQARSKGGVLALLADRNLAGDGIPVEMWGHTVTVAPGPAALALATDTTIYPLMTRYERLRGKQRRAAKSKWGIVMWFGPAVEVPDAEKAEQIHLMSQEWARFLASAIAEYPQDWHMLQRFGWVE